jgi:hypothetical protein
LAGLVLALGLTNHLVLAGLLPAILVFVVATKGSVVWRWLPSMLGALGLAAALVFWTIPDPGAVVTRLVYGPPSITHYFHVSRDVGALARETLFYVLYLAYQFPVAGVALGAWGLVRLFHRDAKTASLLSLAIVTNAAFFINNTEWASLGSAKYVFYIQDYALFAVVIGVGASDLLRRLGGSQRSSRWTLGAVATLALLPMAVYHSAPRVLEVLGLDLTQARTLPYRITPDYFLTPSKRGEASAQQFGEETLRIMDPGAALISDFTPRIVLEYFQRARGVRPDVRLVPCDARYGPVDVAPFVERERGRPIYLVSPDPRYYNLDTLRMSHRIVPHGPVWRLVERSGLMQGSAR